MPYRFTGKFTDFNTGLTQMGARWYNPHTARFLQPDHWNLRNTNLPVEIQHELMQFTGLNTAQLLADPAQQMAYGYVRGNPLRWVDPMGLNAYGLSEAGIYDYVNDAVNQTMDYVFSPKGLITVGGILTTTGAVTVMIPGGQVIGAGMTVAGTAAIVAGHTLDGDMSKALEVVGTEIVVKSTGGLAKPAIESVLNAAPEAINPTMSVFDNVIKNTVSNTMNNLEQCE